MHAMRIVDYLPIIIITNLEYGDYHFLVIPLLSVTSNVIRDTTTWSL